MKVFLRSKKHLTHIPLLFISSISYSFAANIHVPADQSTLKNAVNVASSGDVIILAPGTYTQKSKILISKPLTITSQWHIAGDKQFIGQTILDGEDKDNALFETIHGQGHDFKLSGLTIKRFAYPIILEDSAIIQYNFFSNNSKDTISFEEASSGYAGYNTIETSGDDAIDIDAKEGTFTIEFNTLRNNGDDGIEIRLFSKSKGDIIYDIHDNIITGNDEDGIQLIDHTTDDSGRVFNIYNNILANNTDAGIGSMPDGNTDENFGGANMLERVNFFNNTVINNAVGITGGDNFIALNNIIANNTNEGIKRLRKNSVVAHSIFYNNGSNFSDVITDEGIHLNLDPKYDSLTYELLTGSPSIDSGVASFIWNGEHVLNRPSSEFIGPAPDLGGKESGNGENGENTSPTVSAGIDQIIINPVNSTLLVGTVSDDGLPDVPGAVTTTWSQEAGPGIVTFDTNSITPTATFPSQQGKYQFTLTANDGELEASDSVIVRYVNSSNGGSIPFTSPGTLYIEAENYAYLYGSAQETHDASAFGDITIEAPIGLGVNAFTEHTVIFNQQDITLYFWVRGRGSDQNSDSIFASLNNSNETEITLPSGDYEWIRMPGSFNVSSGSLSLIVRAGGEEGVSWDRFAFSTDPSFIPSDDTVTITEEVRVSSSTDDAEERTASGSMYLNSSDLELVTDGSNSKQQIVGMRFKELSIPQGATILSAYLQFTADEMDSKDTFLDIKGESADHAVTFGSSDHNISNRNKTTSSINWNPNEWTTTGAAGIKQKTPDISHIIQEIVGRAGWSTGNALALIVSGTGERTAESYDGDISGAPLLHIEYTANNGLNQAPIADNVAISGTTEIGQSLVGHYTYSDIDGDAEGASTYRWLRDGAAISGASSESYTLVSADVNARIRFEVTPIAATGVSSGAIVQSAETAPITTIVTNPNQAPTASNVFISGTAKIGQTLTGSYTYNDENGDAEGASTYRWLRDGAAISGASSKSYILVSADLDALIKFEVTPIAATGISSGAIVQSQPVGPVTDGSVSKQTIEVSISSSSDDAEERTSSNRMYLNSSDLELINDGGSRHQRVGLRFNDLSIPQGATILNAYLQFTADESDSIETVLDIQGEYTDNALTFSSSNNISNRNQTVSSVNWNPNEWSIRGEAGAKQKTPDISTVIQEIINRRGWSAGNSLALIISGTGERTAESYDGDRAAAPLLHIEYATTTVGGKNQAPTANNVVIVGIKEVGKTVVGHYDYHDIDGDAEGNSTYRWFRNETPISGATSNSYTLAPADQGTSITFEVKPKANTGISSGSPIQSAPVGPITDATGGGEHSVAVRVSSSSDDAEEKTSSGKVSLSSSDLELSDDGKSSKNQLIGLRFNSLSIPQGATITNAYIQFKADEKDSKATHLSIQGEHTGDALTFKSSRDNISNRQKTTASISWNPVAWTAKGEMGAEQQTPDISTVIQEIVNQLDWATGNSLAIIMTGSGERTAESYDGDSAGAPTLHVEYDF